MRLPAQGSFGHGGPAASTAALVAGLGAIALCYWLGVHFLTNEVVFLGNRIPSVDVTLDYLKGVAWAIVLGLSLLVWPISPRDRGALMAIWLVKVVVVLVFMLFYEYYYDLDCFGYYIRAARTETFRPLRDGADLVLNLASLQNYVVTDSYHALKVSFAMVGLIAVYVLYRSSVMLLDAENIKIFYILALFPSILFWSSIIGKDPVVLLGIAVYVYGIVGWNKRGGIQYLFVSLTALAFVFLIRFWLALILTAPVAALFVRQTSRKASRFTLAVFLVFALGMVRLSVDKFTAQFHITKTTDLIASAETVSKIFQRAGETTGNVGEMHTALSLPIGMFTALYRPLPWEGKRNVFMLPWEWKSNVFIVAAGLENLMLLWLTWRAIRARRTDHLTEPLILWAITFVVVWAAFYGSVATGNLGAAVRFKLQVLPIFLGLLLYLGRPREKGALDPVLATAGIHVRTGAGPHGIVESKS